MFGNHIFHLWMPHIQHLTTPPPQARENERLISFRDQDIVSIGVWWWCFIEDDGAKEAFPY